MFAYEFFRHLNTTVINGTSPPLSHFYWHSNSYCNWGEPWYGGFRESMQEYRINNQAFCERNYLPKMLGWYLLTATTSVSDMEWMLARAAGYDAGFALATSVSALRKNPKTGTILDTIREWEEARRHALMPDDLRAALKQPKNEFHLERLQANEGAGWRLYPFRDSSEFAHEHMMRQPGEPTGAVWEFENSEPRQELQLKLRVTGSTGSIKELALEVNATARLVLPVEVKPGQTLSLETDAVARVYDAKGQQVSAWSLQVPLPYLQPGANRIEFSCEFQGEPAPKVALRFKTKGSPMRLSRP